MREGEIPALIPLRMTERGETPELTTPRMTKRGDPGARSSWDGGVGEEMLEFTPLRHPGGQGQQLHVSLKEKGRSLPRH